MVQAVLAGMLTLTVAASAATFIAANQLAQARRQNRIATSRELAALSGNLLARHLDLAELLLLRPTGWTPPHRRCGAVPGGHRQPAPGQLSPAGGQVSAVGRLGRRQGHRRGTDRRNGAALVLPSTQPTVIGPHGRSGHERGGDRQRNRRGGVQPGGCPEVGRTHGGQAIADTGGQSPAGGGISASGRFTALATNTTGDGPGNQFELTLFDQRVTQVDTVRDRKRGGRLGGYFLCGRLQAGGPGQEYGYVASPFGA